MHKIIYASVPVIVSILVGCEPPTSPNICDEGSSMTIATPIGESTAPIYKCINGEWVIGE